VCSIVITGESATWCVVCDLEWDLSLPCVVGSCVSHAYVVCFYRSAIFSLLLVTDNLVATGDDEGSLKVFVIASASRACKFSCALACSRVTEHCTSHGHQPKPNKHYLSVELKPNSITLAGSKLVADRFQAGQRPASNLSATSFEPASVMEFGREPASSC